MNAFQPWQILLVTVAGWINRQQQDVIAYVQEENGILKTKLTGKRIRLTDDERRRLAVKGKTIGRRVLQEIGSIVTPDTILAWHRRLIAQKWDYSGRRGPGRPRVAKRIAELTVRMARENPRWGYTTIRDSLFNLGHIVARETVRNILKDQGIEPAPERVVSKHSNAHKPPPYLETSSAPRLDDRKEATDVAAAQLTRQLSTSPG